MAEIPTGPKPEASKGGGLGIVIVICVIGLVMMVFGVGAIFAPALSRAKHMANRVVCANNLQAIHLAMATDAVTNEDRFPSHIGLLLDEGLVAAKQFDSPGGGGTVALLPNRTAPLAPYKFGDYYFVYSSMIGTKARAEALLAFSISHDGEGRNVLFGDGTVQWVSESEFLDWVEADNIARQDEGLDPINLTRLGVDIE